MDIRSFTRCRVMLLLCFLTFSGGHSCIYDPGSYGLFTHTGRYIVGGRQVIVPNLTFNCYGRINYVSYSTINASHPGDDEPIIQLWHPSPSGSNVYKLIDQIGQIQTENLIETTQFYYIDAIFRSGRVKFQPGDVLGYYQPSNPRQLLWSITEGGYVSYSINASTAATTINTSNVDYINDGLVPYVRVTFDIQCDNLSIPTNGNISSCSSGRIGVGYERDNCSFTCNTGYELFGSDVRMCQSNGVWNGTDTMCHKDCLPLSNPANGTMQCSLGDDEVESCIFTCNNGYQLIGSHTRTCQGNGSWNGTDSVCKRVCPLLNNPADGIINCSLGDDKVPTYEDTCGFTCNTGYELVGNDTRTCESDGNWSGTEINCTKIVPCPKLNDVSNGMINCSSKQDQEYFYEDTCHITCNTGFVLTGSDTRICQSDGSWSGSDIKCQRVSCSAPNNLENGMSNCSKDQNYFYEDTCHFICNTGYEMIGSNIMMCLSDGSWSVSETKCQTASDKSDLTSVAIGGAVGGAVGGTILSIIVIIYVGYLCTRKRKAEPNPHDNKQANESVHMTTNPAYDVTKPKKNLDQCDYAKHIELPFQDDKYGTIKMDSNPSYGTTKDFNTVACDSATQPMSDVVIQPNPSYGTGLRPSSHMCEDQYSYVVVKSNQLHSHKAEGAADYLDLMESTTTNNHSYDDSIGNNPNSSYDTVSGGIKLEDNPSYDTMNFMHM